MIDNNKRLQEIEVEIRRSMTVQDWVSVGMLKAEKYELLAKAKTPNSDKEIDFLMDMFGFNK